MKIKYQSLQRRKQRARIDTTQIRQPEPKLPFYAGAGDHFGEVRNKGYADKFLEVKDVNR